MKYSNTILRCILPSIWTLLLTSLPASLFTDGLSFKMPSRKAAAAARPPSRPSATSLHSTTSAPTTERKKAIVVGAGPVGIATALTLASAPHSYDVSLFEASPQTSSQEKYDPTKAFLYNVNLRGQVLTKRFPNMQRKLVERGVKSGGFGGVALTIVPADPDVPIPRKADREARMEVKGEMGNDSKKKEKKKKEEDEEPSYWIPRHEMVQLMLEVMEEHEKEREESVGCDVGRIDYRPGQECVSVRPDGTSSCVAVTTRDVSTGEDTMHEATLVVGADGMNSRVRECLATEDADAFKGWSNFNPKKFVPKKWRSPASFQRIKVLQLPPQFGIPDGEGGELITKSEDIYAIRSVYNSPTKYLSLGLLPMKDNTGVRPTNIVTRPDHEIWTYNDGDSVRQWFEKAYPRMPFDKDGGMISDDEWDRFAKAEGTRFPPCQYSRGMAICDDDGTCGVALVGDAIHAFPPDIGQGVNSGLADVVALDRALRGLDTVTGEEIKSEESPSFKSNLERYQKQHEPEIAALIRLARFGAPFQYKQPHRIDRLRLKLWTANVVFRLLLNKLTFGVVPPQCMLLSLKPELTFRQVMRRSDLTSRSIKALLLGWIGWLLVGKFGLPKLPYGFGLPVLGM